MSRKDKRPESNPERAKEGEEISRKATNPHIAEDEATEGQTEGGQERGPEPGQYKDKGSPGYTPK